MNLRNVFCRIRIRYASFLPLFLQTQERAISFYWITKIFNIVDHHRIKEVGPNITCAEWLLKNGASVRFKGSMDLLSDYNKLINLESLPDSINFRIEEVHAKEVSLTKNGFEHFKNCNNILKMTFINCPLEDEALVRLAYIKNTLQFLEMRSCIHVGDAGLLSLAQLSNLKMLTLVNLPSVKKKDECETALRKALPKCQIDFH